MRIIGIAGRLVRISPTVRWSDAVHAIDELEYIFAEIVTEDGHLGVGYSYTLGFGGSSVLDLIEQTLAPQLLGIEVMDATGKLEELLQWLHPVGQGGVSSLAIAALDTAVWDVRARMVNLPLYQFLGARRQSIRAYASGIDLHLSADELVARVASYLDQGYTAVKIKVGREDAEEDVERVRAVRARIGSRCLLMLDANQRWSAGETVRRARLLEQFDPLWLEEPVRADDIEAHTAAKARMRIPLASGETVFTAREGIDLVERRGVDIMQADVARLGGLTQWLKVANIAEARGIPMAPHFVVELSIHALCVIPNASMAEYVMGGTLTDLGLLKEPIRPVHGVLSPPSRPGLGVEYDSAALDRHTVTAFGESVLRNQSTRCPD